MSVALGKPLFLAALAFAALAFVTGGVWAQDFRSGRDFRDGDGRGDFGSRGDRSGGGGRSSRGGGGPGGSSFFDSFAQRMDRNGDGQIDPSELDERSRMMFNRMAERAGLDPGKPISIDQFREAMTSRGGSRGDRGSPGDRSDRGGDNRQGDAASVKSGAAAEPNPLVPGFTLAQSLPEVPGFGVRVPGYSVAGSDVALASPAGDSGDSSSSDSDKNALESSAREIAKRIVENFDRDKNGSLTKDEWGQMSPIARGVDVDQDGSLGEDELVKRIVEDFKQFGGWSSLSRFALERPYRVASTSAAPEGLPSWFAQKDVDGDGQVAMYEYASRWSDSTVRDFSRYDLNNDGLITPAEYFTSTGGAPSASAVSAKTTSPPKSDAREESSDDNRPFWMRD